MLASPSRVHTHMNLHYSLANLSDILYAPDKKATDSQNCSFEHVRNTCIYNKQTMTELN